MERSRGCSRSSSGTADRTSGCPAGTSDRECDGSRRSPDDPVSGHRAARVGARPRPPVLRQGGEGFRALRAQCRKCVPCALMVFDKLFELFAIFFELHRRIIHRPGSPLRFVQHHLVAVLFYPFVYSSNSGLHWHLLLRHFAPVTVVEAFSAGCWSLKRRYVVVHPPSHIRYWQHRYVPSSPRSFRSWQT
jgi:hypothetical protein